ncbi:NAD(P)-dependent oxidoreductase [Promicromonospora iranensis]|uniref:Glyoxylate/hydroxypyruvate reductase A n=1 Tax=Promicromonospora iranensis TaxID=1105144 RepID=A0ABU2CH08_9MICO|nr:NAD(P)-dependent oxidoreductase [Promicromonospora iranensis]MDR7380628.1 glyoxylate/hydroxypyruvate reductase A [Promicromonospora iranensis]
MSAEHTTADLAEALRISPTVRLGDDVEPGWRDAIAAWARSRDLEITGPEVTGRAATLAITTTPGNAAGAAWVHSPYAGVEHLAPALPGHVLLTRTTGTMPQRIAEYVLAWVLAERWQTARYVADSASATWDPSDPPAPPGRNGTVVVGTGAMGTAIARTLATLGHHVTGLSRSGRPDAPFDAVLPLGGTPDPSALDGLDGPGVDVLVLALPHTPQTTGLITPEFLRAFDGVHLVNIGRGSAVRTDTLLDAIATGHVRHATLDVTEEEPLGPSSPLWRRPEVTITPHVSGLTLPSDVVAGLDAALSQVRAGVRPTSAVALDRGY